MKSLPLALAGLLIGAPAWADDVSGTDRLLCSASGIIVCFEEGDCAELTAEELGRLASPRGRE